MVASMNKGDVVLFKAFRSEKLEELAEMIKIAWSKRIQEMADSE